MYYWRAEPLEVDWVLDGSWGAWAIEVKTGAYQPRDLRGLLEFCRLYPRFQPLLLCNEGDEAFGRDGGVRTQSWANFLMHGPDALVVRTNTSRPQRAPKSSPKEGKRRESAENITRGRCAGPRGDAKPLISCLIRGHWA